MSKKPESLFRQKVDKELKQIPNSWWESIQQKAIQGTPDKLGCVNGVFIALELKASKTSKLTALQELKLNQISKAGGIGLLVFPENLEEILDLLHYIAKDENDQAKLEAVQRKGLH